MLQLSTIKVHQWSLQRKPNIVSPRNIVVKINFMILQLNSFKSARNPSNHSPIEECFDFMQYLSILFSYII